MSKLIKIVAPILGEQDLEKFNTFIKQDNINSARLLVERKMIDMHRDSIEYAILNEVQDALINEIEVEYDSLGY